MFWKLTFLGNIFLCEFLAVFLQVANLFKFVLLSCPSKYYLDSFYRNRSTIRIFNQCCIKLLEKMCYGKQKPNIFEAFSKTNFFITNVSLDYLIKRMQMSSFFFLPPDLFSISTTFVSSSSMYFYSVDHHH